MQVKVELSYFSNRYQGWCKLGGCLGLYVRVPFGVWSCGFLNLVTSLQLQITPFTSSSDDYSGLISFRIDWFDLLAVQGTLKSLVQHHSSKASILLHSTFFTVQLSHPYMTTGKTIALTRCNFVGKVMSLLFNMLSRLVIAFLPRSKRLLTSWLQGMVEEFKSKETMLI